MRMKTPALLTGPYDWDPALIPVTEFERRLAAVRQVLAEQNISLLLVHGNSIEYGELAYLTAFAPKLGSALAMVPLEGPIRLLISGSSTMLSAAKRLTWVENLDALSNLRIALNDRLPDAARSETPRIGIWGHRTMTRRLHAAIDSVVQPLGTIAELASLLDPLRLHKSPCELELLRRASAILAVAIRALIDAAGSGCGVRSGVLAAERAAFDNGAQDVRTLASATDGAPPIAFDGLEDIAVKPLLACIAVRFAGYWAEGFVTVGAEGESFAGAQRALAAMLREARAGTTFAELESIAARHLSPHVSHPFIDSAVCNSVGLTLEELPESDLHDTSQLCEGVVYSLRTGAAAAGKDIAIVSAMLAVTQAGIEVLWSALDSLAVRPANRDSR